MLHAPQGAGSVEPPLVRLLARLTDLDAADSGQLPWDRLGQCLAWTDAIALAHVLDGEAPAARSGTDSAQASDCARLRVALADAIAADGMLGDAPQRGQGRQPVREHQGDAVVDYELYRDRYLLLQQKMATRIGKLRSGLRAALAAQGGEMARLAALDAVMEQVLGARERSLLGRIPTLLQSRFEHLRDAEGEAPKEAAKPLPAWLDTFRKDARGVLLAELDLRFQPVAGLAEALAGR